MANEAQQLREIVWGRFIDGKSDEHLLQIVVDSEIQLLRSQQTHRGCLGGLLSFLPLVSKLLPSREASSEFDGFEATFPDVEVSDLRSRIISQYKTCNEIDAPKYDNLVQSYLHYDADTEYTARQYSFLYRAFDFFGRVISATMCAVKAPLKLEARQGVAANELDVEIAE